MMLALEVGKMPRNSAHGIRKVGIVNLSSAFRFTSCSARGW